MENNDRNLNIIYHYPRSEEWIYESSIERLNLDEEKDRDLEIGKGFVVKSAKVAKDGSTDPEGIYSSRFGQTLRDINPFANRYRCMCGNLQSKFYNGIECPECHTKVRYVSDEFDYYGWIILNDEYHIIHPNIYKSIAYLIGQSEFENIMAPIDRKDEDGQDVENPVYNKDNPYIGIGPIGFYEKFDEILDFYGNKNIKKISYYEDIKANRDKVFTHSIPVYTTHLRPFKLEDGVFNYEGTNSIYHLMVSLANDINKDSLKIYKKKKPKNQLLYNLQSKYNELYEEIIKIIQGKKGTIRAAFGGRFNFSARSVIVPEPSLRIDEVRLSYQCLVGMLQQVIINILHKLYNMTYDRAYTFLVIENSVQENEIIKKIIEGIIKDTPRGIPLLINRNPTISYGGILQMYCIGISDGYTMHIPLQVLKGLGADFDGDTLNILYIINQRFLESAQLVFNPRNTMYISKNDGEFNSNCNHQRDTLINLNSLLYLSRDYYSEEQLKMLEEAKKYDND